MKKLIGILLAVMLLGIPLLGCTPTDPITDDVYIEGVLYVWDGGAYVAVGAGGGTDEDAIHDNIAGEIVAIAEKGAPAATDVLIIEDSADGNNKKRVQITNLPPGGAHTLDGGQSDVTITGVADNEVLAYDLGTTEWINQTLAASDIGASELGVATYDDVQDYINFFGDRTLLSGGAISDNGDGTATVALGKAWAKATDSDTAVGNFFDFSADASVSLTDLTTNYIYVDYNAGTPQIVVATSKLTHGFKQDHIIVGAVYRDGNTLHLHQADNLGIGRVNRVHMHNYERYGVERVSGIVTNSTGTRNLSITTGVVYEGLNRHITNAFDTSVADIFSYWYYDGDLGTPAWVEVTGATQISNTQYNDVATGLANLTANRYGVHWVYIDTDGENLHVVYGQGDYRANEAEEVGIPSSLPNVVTNYCVLIAKIINQEGTNTLTITYPWTSAFTSSLATDHGSLAGLSDDDHTQYVANADFNARGDLLTATADDTPSIQGVGANGTVLTADSGEADGIKWATPAGGGVSYTELAGTVTTTAAGEGAGDGAWVDWDLSGTLPVRTETAEIHIYKLSATDSVGVRKDGSALAREQELLKFAILTVMVEVEATRIVEIQSDDVSDADVFSLWGYWD